MELLTPSSRGAGFEIGWNGVVDRHGRDGVSELVIDDS